MKYKFGQREISANQVLFIAEAGVNHNGSIVSAKELAVAAKRAGAQIIKFQTYTSEKLVSNEARKFWVKDDDTSVYQSDTYSKSKDLSPTEYRELKSYCDEIGIEFLSTPFDSESLNLLVEIGVKAIKIASCDITNHTFIKEICETGLPIFLSTGASTIHEVEEAVSIIASRNVPLSILHCVLSYPTPPKYVNLSSINYLQNKFPEFPIGFSDHTLGLSIPLAAVAKGAIIIEKHFTTDKNLKTPGDHWFAIDESELKNLVLSCNEVLQAIGIEEKIVQPCENLSREQARRSLFTARDIPIGEILKVSDFIALRPGLGMQPNMLDKIVGKRLKVNKLKHQFIKETDFE
jgi:sialic acid synthase SpsE